MRHLTPLVAVALLSCSGDDTDTDTDTDTDVQASACVTPASTTFVRPFEVDETLYPFESCAFETPSGTLHYLDLGPKDAEHTVLMVHGNPTWSFLYRGIIPELLADGHRVVVPDHLGSGMSDVPPSSAYDFRPRSHADHLEDLVLALDLDGITLVVQDWGGPIGLGMGTRQPDRVEHMLIMNTWAWSVDAENPGPSHAVVDWYNQAKQGAQLRADWFCSFPFPGQAELTASGVDPSRGPVFEAVRSAYLSPAIDPATGAYKTDEPCLPMQRFAESIIDDDAFQGEVEGRLSTLRGKPYALLFGQSDPLFGALRCDAGTESPCPGTSTCVCDPELLPERLPPDCASAPQEYHVCKEPDDTAIEPYADRFQAILGEASLVLRESVPDSDHFVQEDAPDRVVAAIRTLLSE